MNQVTAGFYAMSMRLFSMLREGGGDLSGRGHSVLVTSARPGEGKTYVSRMLARCMADLMNDDVLLVDASLERPALHEVFGLPSEGGFTDCVANPAGEDLARYVRSSDNHFVLTVGRVRKPGLLFKTQSFEDFLAGARTRFGLVLIDGGPLMMTGCMPHQCDGVIMVIDSSRTRREVVLGVMNQAKVDRRRYLGVVLNKRSQYIPQSLYRRF